MSTVTLPSRRYRFYDFLMAAFVAVVLSANLIGPAKVCEIPLPVTLPIIGSALVFGAGNLFFPVSYIFGDVLTEVYGYARTRRVIWAGFGAMVFASAMTQLILRLPPDADEPFNQVLQPALETVFGGTWRIVVASIFAFWAGDFVNSYVMARMKLLTSGRWLWTRTIGSTLVGQGVDSMLFYPLAFYGIWSNQTLITVILVNWTIKISVEVVMTPVTYVVVGGLKQLEAEDYYDRGTNFTPFSLSDR